MRKKNKVYTVLCASLVLTLTGISVSSAQQLNKESSSEKSRKNAYYFKKILENEINFLKEELKQQEDRQSAALEEQKKGYEARLREQKQEAAAAASEAKMKLEEKEAELLKRYETQASERISVLEKQNAEALTAAREAKKKQEETDAELLKQKEALQQQKAQYETLLGEYKKITRRSYEDSSVIAELKSKLEQLQADYDKQSKDFDQVLVQEALEQEMKIAVISEQIETATAIAAKEKKEMQDIMKLLSEKTAQINDLQEEKRNLNARFAQLEKDYGNKFSAQQKEYESRLQMILSPKPAAAESQLHREQEGGEPAAQVTAKDTQIKALQQQVNDLNEKIEKNAREHEADLSNERRRQKAVSEQQLARKDEEYKEKHRELIDKYRKEVEDAQKAVEQKLADKYQQFADALREKEKMIAENELEYNSKFEEQKNSLEAEIASQQKSFEQLKMYLGKLEDELKLQSASITEKDNHIALLTNKLAMYSGEEYADEKKISALMQEEIISVKRDNDRLRQEVEALKSRLVEEKSSYEETLTRQQRAIQDLQQVSVVKATSDTQGWEKKMHLMEKKYLWQIRDLELQNEKTKEECELKLKSVVERMRTKAAEDENLKNKLAFFRQNQITLLEEMLLSKATMMKKLPPDFFSAEKERAQIYFERAMDAIMERNYSRAKYELDMVLEIEQNNQIAISMQESVKYLLEKKQ